MTSPVALSVCLSSTRLPLSGGLLGNRGRQLNDTELFVFLTPRVLRTDAEVEGAMRLYQRQAPRR